MFVVMCVIDWQYAIVSLLVAVTCIVSEYSNFHILHSLERNFLADINHLAKL